jgi:hypothetical protein
MPVVLRGVITPLWHCQHFLTEGLNVLESWSAAAGVPWQSEHESALVFVPCWLLVEVTFPMVKWHWLQLGESDLVHVF